MSTIKNGKYGDAEAERLGGYDHPEYAKASTSKNGPTFGPKKNFTRGELNDRIMNEDAGSWRGVKDDPNY